MTEFHHSHEPRAEEIALHQKYLTLEGQIDAARLEGDEAEVRRASLRSPSEPRHAESRPIGDSFARTSHDEQEVSMERFSFGDDVAFAPRGNLLDGVTIAPLTQPFEEGALVQAAIFRFEPGARLRRHPATMPEIFAVLEGSGEVSGANGVDAPIGAGEAVFWHEGDEQEMKSEVGLTVLIIHGESVDRFRGRPATLSAPE